MGNLEPIAFDIETTGLNPASVVTVIGLATDVGAWMGLNTTGREADAAQLMTEVEYESGSNVRVSVYRDEHDLLAGFEDFTTETVNGDRHFITAHNGERWKGGFDLMFMRRACVRRGVDWPFPDVAFADTMDVAQRFYPDDVNDLETVYGDLIGNNHHDPFDDSAQAVTSHENGDWIPLLLHNLADIERTRELAVLAGRYVPKSDFKMKNLGPPDV